MRWPRLRRAMKDAAILGDTEVDAALRDYITGRDQSRPDLIRFGGGEAVVHYGGPLAVIRGARQAHRIQVRLGYWSH